MLNVKELLKCVEVEKPETRIFCFCLFASFSITNFTATPTLTKQHVSAAAP